MKWRIPSPRHSAWTTQKRRSGGDCGRFYLPGIDPKTSRTFSDVFYHYANRVVQQREQKIVKKAHKKPVMIYSLVNIFRTDAFNLVRFRRLYLR